MGVEPLRANEFKRLAVVDAFVIARSPRGSVSIRRALRGFPPRLDLRERRLRNLGVVAGL